MATLQEALTPEIQEFCSREGILDALRTAIDLVEEYFPEAHDMRAEIVWDPDNNADEWVSLTFSVHGSVDEVVARENQVTDRWTAEVAWPGVDKVVVLFDIV